MLNTEELEVLMDGVWERLNISNRDGTLPVILSKIGWDDLLPQKEESFTSYANGKIVILGASEVQEKVLFGIAKTIGLSKGRFELCLDYEAIKHYNFRKLQFAPSYRVVLVGPMPHKTAGSGNFSSAIESMKNEQGYPIVIELKAGTEIKITKNNLREALVQLVNSGYLACDK